MTALGPFVHRDAVQACRVGYRVPVHLGATGPVRWEIVTRAEANADRTLRFGSEPDGAIFVALRRHAPAEASA